MDGGAGRADNDIAGIDALIGGTIGGIPFFGGLDDQLVGLDMDEDDGSGLFPVDGALGDLPERDATAAVARVESSLGGGEVARDPEEGNKRHAPKGQWRTPETEFFGRTRTGAGKRGGNNTTGGNNLTSLRGGGRPERGQDSGIGEVLLRKATSAPDISPQSATYSAAHRGAQSGLFG
eukprot:CAMPEP_0171978014 /NCGR_PEP_ID=MMETSP0993-20121228/249849_1 /TAXON_ID=483369 /ORGANISM="non described non described, Strain CCMP2098" /LENGTH=177 /DNA_ID=CAMNT_0012629847 /DNA_START=128 /DNA_END=658 /DNA_ORIENTATION=+